MTEPNITKPTTSRIPVIDVARGLALFAMAIYHFAWDLEFFGYVPQGMTADGGWRIFARSIASSFLFLVGVSLVLAHGRQIRWRPLIKRLAMIVAAAAAITVASRIATPERYIFFGILHSIAVATVLGVLFIRAPALFSAAVGIAIIIFTPDLVDPLFNQPFLLWLGLSTETVQSNDFVPVFPWFGPVLLGMAAARFALDRNLVARLASIYRGSGTINTGLIFTGRHSLAFYLIHQPVLVAAVYAVSLIAPPPPPDPKVTFMNSCNYSCSLNNESAFCSRFCTCTLDRLVEEDLLDAIMTEGKREQSQTDIQAIARACTSQSIEEAPSQ
ncbi:MAG: DUF1624 domain-containing protein [Alphaproteobacteria bacterium]|nr:DUF1624 domain-containing protein [Alphaproteobacteria bacterium]